MVSIVLAAVEDAQRLQAVALRVGHAPERHEQGVEGQCHFHAVVRHVQPAPSGRGGARSALQLGAHVDAFRDEALLISAETSASSRVSSREAPR